MCIKCIMITLLVAAATLWGTVSAANETVPPWTQPGWERITDEERQPATEQEIEQVMLPTLNQNGVRYLTGGFGVAERAWLAKHGAAYPLRIEFSRGLRGEFVSDVKLTLRDAQGQVVFEATSEGPLMYIDLPLGRYSGEAVYAGQSRHFSVSVPRLGQARTYINFP